MKMKLLLVALTVVVGLSSCKKDKKEDTCFADSLLLTETKTTILPAQDAVYIDFDVKNTSNSSYAISSGAKAVYLTVVVTTTDNSAYTTTEILPIIALNAGATGTAPFVAKFGANKAYKSHKITAKYCD